MSRQGRLLAVALCAASSAACAHDSWLRPAEGGQGLELTTGTRFPVGDVGQAPASVLAPGCTDGAWRLAMRPAALQAKALALEVEGGEAAPVACWLELAEAAIELEPRLVRVYLDEIRAPSVVRERAAALRARGVPWRERYRKFARIELTWRSATAAAREQARRPVGHPLEIVVLGGEPVAVNGNIALQVLRDGRPLPDFPVELVSERSPLGIWRTTDAQGRLQHRLPFGGQWLLRGTDVRPSAKDPDAWESRFVTLVLDLR
jgi:hypothetical protein